MSYSQPTPPLLFTKRLTTFLSSNLNAHLHTALLATPSGRLLAHASPHPVSLLRTQSTVASSLFALHASTAPDIPDALPPSPSNRGVSLPAAEGGRPLTVTVQLADGVVVIRRLKCGLLFVCIGPLAEHIEAAGGDAHHQHHQHHQQQHHGGIGGGHAHNGERSGGATPSQMPASPSEVDSVLSVGGITTASLGSVGSVNTAGVVVMRRHAEELSRWLDDKLGSLRVPEEGVGVE
ncbi:hypothetical protein Cob_v010081 [Colletotrichum orbiculare MAFF 240422]|uniref:Uncharacterized protein n=1 Tax=Colletotrichum orbiculare (strain 104-T / ATCC 96160 / CBS 514.97 / LARS 414 / MAFF 240422) TaxID=1213857 RepID=N4VGS9_COLOR|nr:hypothetical protein Cob_v010081 [Colletotrichum orbiculare MAFF 240422]